MKKKCGNGHYCVIRYYDVEINFRMIYNNFERINQKIYRVTRNINVKYITLKLFQILNTRNQNELTIQRENTYSMNKY